jgi:putative sterol carrier protein
MPETRGLEDMTPERFAEMVSQGSDEEVASAIRAVGTETTLDRIFTGMQERFRADKASGVDADIQFIVTDEGEEHPYVVAIKNGSCTTKQGTADDPKVTLTTDVVSFSKLITNNASGPQLFMSGKLKVSGDIFFSQKITSFFDQPSS